MTGRSRIFSSVRFEHEERPLYFLPSVINELEQPICRYLIGNRGTGKTTLLRAMSWQERLENTSLRSQIGQDPFRDRYLGIYVRVPRFLFGRMDRWLSALPLDVASGIFAWYFDSIWLQHAALAVAELVARGNLSIDPEAETAAIRSVLDEYLEVEWMPSPAPETFLELRRAMNCLQRTIESWASAGSPPSDALLALPGQIGEFGRSVGKALLSTCRFYRPDGSMDAFEPTSGWRFQICLDEAEELSERQQLALNTLVRLSEFPIFIVASFVSRPIDMTTTALPRLTIQHADLETTTRDKLGSGEFRKLANGVVNARIRAVLGDRASDFSIDAVLGPTDLNELLLARIKGSENRLANQLLDDANLLASKMDERRGGLAAASQAPPIWQAYALRSREGRIPDIPASTAMRFPDGGLRKRNLTTYFAIHAAYGWVPRYVGSKVALDLSDCCVRDLLWQMDEILSRITKTDAESGIRQLAKGTRVAPDLQNAAFREASSKKIKRLHASVIESPEVTGRVVIGLGQRTASMQRATEARGLGVEPGMFVLVEDSSEECQRALRVIRDAVESGYLKLESNPREPWRFRLHKSLAPYFDLPWRGAYRQQRVSAWELLSLADDTVPRQISDGDFAAGAPNETVSLDADGRS